MKEKIKKIKQNPSPDVKSGSPLKEREKSFKQGFTLVELLVVISIIGILTIVVTATFSTTQMKARDLKRKAELNSLAKALQMYYTDKGRFPVAALGDPDINSLMQNQGEFVDNSYVYMKVLPKESKGSPWPVYFYEVSSSGTSYNLFADLENKKDSECNSTPWQRGSNSYCYGIASPNVKVGITVP